MAKRKVLQLENHQDQEMMDNSAVAQTDKLQDFIDHFSRVEHVDQMSDADLSLLLEGLGKRFGLLGNPQVQKWMELFV